MENLIIVLLKKQNSVPIFYKVFETTDNKFLVMNLIDNFDIIDNFNNKVEILNFFENIVDSNNYDSFFILKNNNLNNYINSNEKSKFDEVKYQHMINSFKENFKLNNEKDV